MPEYAAWSLRRRCADAGMIWVSTTKEHQLKYEDFVASKRRAEVATGHNPSELNEHLFDFQHAIVTWAVRRGRAAIFADTGLGKTLMQLSWADEIATHTGGMVLILAPLAVSEQTIEQGATFGIDVRRVSNGADEEDD